MSQPGLFAPSSTPTTPCCLNMDLIPVTTKYICAFSSDSAITEDQTKVFLRALSDYFLTLAYKSQSMRARAQRRIRQGS